MTEAIAALLGVIVGAALELFLKKFRDSEEVNDDLHYLFTELEANIINLENTEDASDPQPLRAEAVEKIISSKAGRILRGDILRLLLTYQMEVSAYNQELEETSTCDLSRIKKTMHELLTKLIKFSDKRKFIPSVKIRGKKLA